MRFSGYSSLTQAPSALFTSGTADEPITFTTSETLVSGQENGQWGGLIILGRAPVYGFDANTDDLEIEGLTGK